MKDNNNKEVEMNFVEKMENEVDKIESMMLMIKSWQRSIRKHKKLGNDSFVKQLEKNIEQYTKIITHK
jgi:hypothetical protein